MKQLKVLLFNGSTNKKGNSEEVLVYASDRLKENGVAPEIFWIGPDHIHECKFCHRCLDTGRCVIDDPVNDFVEKAREADGFIFAAPVSRVGRGGSVASFIERCLFVDVEAFRLKPTAVITLAKRAADNPTHDMLNKHIASSEMPILASKYWNIGTNGSSPTELFKNKENVKEICTIANSMVYYLKCIEAGKEAGVERPEKILSAFDVPKPDREVF
jgi:Multimeric flavodoxin WrbA